MAGRRRFRSAINEKSRAVAAAEAARPDYFKQLLQDLKLLDIKRSVIQSNRRNLPWLFVGIVPILGMLALVPLLIAIFILGTYLGTIFGPFGVLERLSKARADTANITNRISHTLPELGDTRKVALAGVRRVGKRGIEFCSPAVRLDGALLSRLTTDGEFIPLGKYRKLAVIPLDEGGLLAPDFAEMKDQYWLGDARSAGLADTAIQSAQGQLEQRSLAPVQPS
jgi:hypothetical protein